MKGYQTTGDFFDHIQPLSAQGLEDMLKTLPPSMLIRARISLAHRILLDRVGTLTYAGQDHETYKAVLDRAVAECVGDVPIPDYIVAAMATLSDEDLKLAVQIHMSLIDTLEGDPKQKRVFFLLLREIGEQQRRKEEKVAKA